MGRADSANVGEPMPLPPPSSDALPDDPKKKKLPADAVPPSSSRGAEASADDVLPWQQGLHELGSVTPPPLPPELLAIAAAKADSTDEASADSANHEAAGSSGDELMPWQRGSGNRADISAKAHELPEGANVGESDRSGGVAGWISDAAADAADWIAGGIKGVYSRIAGAVFHWPIFGHLLVFAMLFALWVTAHFAASSAMPGVDAYYHIRMGVMYRDRGPLAFDDGKFPWTQAAVFRDQWADKEWLYHVGLSVFTWGWNEPPADRATVETLDGAIVRLPADSAALAGDTFFVRAALDSSVDLATITLDAPISDAEINALQNGLLSHLPTGQTPTDGKFFRGTIVRHTSLRAPLRAGMPIVHFPNPTEMAAAVDEAESVLPIVGQIVVMATGTVIFPALPADGGSSVAQAEIGAELTLTDAHRGVGFAVVGRAAPALPFDDRDAPPDRRYIAVTAWRLDAEIPAKPPHPTAPTAPNGSNAVDGAGAVPNGADPPLFAFALADFRSLVDPFAAKGLEWRGFAGAELPPGDTARATPFGASRQGPLAGTDTLEKRGKIAGAFFVAVLTWVMFLIFRQHRLPVPLLLVALIFVGADLFGWRLFMTRPHVFAIALALLGFHWALLGRRIPLFVLGVVYVLSYTAAHAIVVLVTLTVAARFVLGDVRFWRAASMPAATVAGAILGFVLHPNALNYLHIFAIQNVAVYVSSFLERARPVLQNALPVNGEWTAMMNDWIVSRPNLRMGTELQSPVGAEIVAGLWPIWLLGAAIVFVFLARGQRPSNATLTAMVVAMAWSVMFGLSQRFIEYLAPFSAVFFAFAVVEMFRGAQLGSAVAIASRSRFHGFFAIALITALVVAAVLGGAVMNYHVVSTYEEAPEHRDVALFIRDQLPTESTVFTTDWHDFVGLIHYTDRQHFLVMLDPNFMFYFTPNGRAPGEIWAMWDAIRTGRTKIADPAHIDDTGTSKPRDWIEVLRSEFSADYVLCAHSQTALLANLRARTDTFDPIFSDDRFSVFRLVPPPPSAEE